MRLRTLEEISLELKLDKNIQVRHDYIPIYTYLFEPIRFLVQNILEIGIGVVEEQQMPHCQHVGYRTGNSLRCWREYFANANVYGMDKYETQLQEDRITTFVGDQFDEKDLNRICQTINHPLDIIIDDGSHLMEHQVFTFMRLSPFLEKQGLYIIEDIQPEAQAMFRDLSIFSKEEREYISKHFDATCYDMTRNGSGSNDDFIMVFYKI